MTRGHTPIVAHFSKKVNSYYAIRDIFQMIEDKRSDLTGLA